MRARDNPFRTAEVLRVRYRLLEGTWSGLMARLAELGYRAALVGPDGSGKTTLLEDLEPRLAEQGFGIRWVRLSDARRALPRGAVAALFAEVDGRDVILCDGADLMERLAWRRFRRGARAAAGLVVTAHRPGLLPTLLECRTTPELFREIVREILAGQDTVVRDWPAKRLDALFAKHGGNVRHGLRELYDICAGQGR